MGSAGDQDTTRLGDGFEPRGDIDAVAVEIAALDHHIAEIDADAKHEMTVLRLAAIGGGHAMLQIDRALHGVDGARDLHQPSVAGDLENAAVVLSDQGPEDARAPRACRPRPAPSVCYSRPHRRRGWWGGRAGRARPAYR